MFVQSNIHDKIFIRYARVSPVSINSSVSDRTSQLVDPYYHYRCFLWNPGKQASQFFSNMRVSTSLLVMLLSNTIDATAANQSAAASRLHESWHPLGLLEPW